MTFLRGIADEVHHRWPWLLLPMVLPIAWIAAPRLGWLDVLVRSGPLWLAAFLLGTRLGSKEGEGTFGGRIGQLGVQALALCVPLVLLADGAADPEEAMWVQVIDGGIAILLWSTTAGATRFARGPAILAGPAFALALLAIPQIESRYGARKGWESAIGGRWGLLVAGALLIALWPRRIGTGRWISRPIFALMPAVLVADLARSWLSAPRWSTEAFHVDPAPDSEDIAWVRTSGGATASAGTLGAGVITNVVRNTQPHAGPGGSALYYSLRERHDGVTSDPHPNAVLFVPGEPVLACDANGSGTPNWRPDGRAAAMGNHPVTVLDIDQGCARIDAWDVAWLPSGMVQLKGKSLETQDGLTWAVEGRSRLVQVGRLVYLDGASGAWLVREDGPTRLGEGAVYGGDRRFDGAVCLGVPASGYRCWRGSEGLPAIADGLDAVAPGVGWDARDGHEALVDAITGEARSLPALPVRVQDIRVRGDYVDLFATSVWYTWAPGEEVRKREYTVR